MSRRIFWTCAIFYFFIAFEFIYMASPFAIYAYSIYGPGLSFIKDSPTLSWLCRMFLPHIVVETSSFLLNLHNVIGVVLALIGFSIFCMSAAQVYYNKITWKGIVTGGVYNFIRHPQYGSLIICSFGLLLLWPRYIVLLSFIAMLFAYYFLAKIEESECEDKFGESYKKYKRSTGMFSPFHAHCADKLPGIPKSGLKRYGAIIVLYVVTLVIAVGLANGLARWSVNSLYGLYYKDAAYISVTKVEEKSLRNIVEIASANSEVQMRLAHDTHTTTIQYLNYIIPAAMYISEIPMNNVEEVEGHHFLRGDYSKSLYKIIYTKKVETRTNYKPQGREILLNAVKRVPVFEVYIDLNQNRVTKIVDPPSQMNYENIPMPVF